MPASPSPPAAASAPFVTLTPADEATLARLPLACSEAIRRAAKEMRYTAVLAHVTAAFEAVGFPRGNVYALPASLTPEQLELARFAAEPRGLPSTGFAMPGYQPCRRGWLDGGRALDKPIEIEVDGVVRTEPIWRALQIAAQTDQIDQLVVSRLPLESLLDVFVELHVEQKGGLVEYVGALPGGRAFTEPAVKRVVSEVKGDCGRWAVHAADRLLSIKTEPKGAIPMAVRWPVFLALARGKTPIEPRWDHLVPLASAIWPSRCSSARAPFLRSAEPRHW